MGGCRLSVRASSVLFVNQCVAKLRTILLGPQIPNAKERPENSGQSVCTPVTTARIPRGRVTRALSLPADVPRDGPCAQPRALPRSGVRRARAPPPSVGLGSPYLSGSFRVSSGSVSVELLIGEMAAGPRRRALWRQPTGLWAN